MKQRRQQVDYQERRTAFARSLLALVLLIAVFVAVAFFCIVLERRMRDDPPVRGDLSQKLRDEDTLVYHGQTYARNEMLTTILFIGTDKQLGRTTTSSRFRSGGQADFLGLLVIDHEDKTLRWVPIDRDTMTEIMVMGIMGDSATPKLAQICLAQGYGNGEKENCRSTVEAVEGLLKGVKVDFFVSLNLWTVSMLNDAVGGVEVTLEDDFSALDPMMQPGVTLTLNGQQAQYYVHERMAIGDGQNQSRMRRQSMFMESLGARMIERMKENPQFLGALYDLLGDSLVTNMKRGRIVNESNRSMAYRQLDDAAIPGVHTSGETGYTEFYADEAALEKVVIDIFYKPVFQDQSGWRQ